MSRLDWDQRFLYKLFHLILNCLKCAHSISHCPRLHCLLVELFCVFTFLIFSLLTFVRSAKSLVILFKWLSYFIYYHQRL